MTLKTKSWLNMRDLKRQEKLNLRKRSKHARRSVHHQPQPESPEIGQLASMFRNLIRLEFRREHQRKRNANPKGEGNGK